MDPKGSDDPISGYAPDDMCRRQSVSGVLADMIRALKSRLEGFEELKKLADRVEPGSPLEETLWEALIAWQRGRPM